MDTITQLALGGAVGEAVLGKKMGNKGPLWGAAIGIVPDLDVVVLPFVSQVEALAIHRGISHSLLFCAIAAPLFGWLLNRRYKEKNIGWGRWAWMVCLALLTHIGIDVCTTYGTQILQPFSNQLFSLNSIFIIDPFYTVPLIAGLITALFMQRDSLRRRWVNRAGLALSSLYLIAGLAIKTHVNDVFDQNLAAQGIRAEQQMTTPTPFNIFLWTGYAVEQDTIHTGLYSIFDNDTQIEFQSVDRQAHLLASYREQLPVERLLWFSQGYFVADGAEGNLLVHDLRFGRSDLWLTDQPAPYVWNYRLLFNGDSSKVTGFNRFEPNFARRAALFGQLIERVLGEDT
ncbi:metal-dependent hydrolase [Fodinibius salsisoli]|uniref:Metal-dependent hydrolase n=1 Tax=Fodinibius salsisoli TaxID=2820877 RepID=A0ABT3PI55_9BACT|nr:metal-dependent hydrolase [Fodinibius salsisoli]MCW9705607.1 metal-dependent hydrolase [Fodinibius salsisoli]